MAKRSYSKRRVSSKSKKYVSRPKNKVYRPKYKKASDYALQRLRASIKNTQIEAAKMVKELAKSVVHGNSNKP